MITYECEITGYLNQYDESPKELALSITSEYPLTPKDLKKECAKQIPLEYTKLGPMRITGEYDEEININR